MGLGHTAGPAFRAAVSLTQYGPEVGQQGEKSPYTCTLLV